MYVIVSLVNYDSVNEITYIKVQWDTAETYFGMYSYFTDFLCYIFSYNLLLTVLVAMCTNVPNHWLLIIKLIFHKKPIFYN